jgi:hypothetical protein
VAIGDYNGLLQVDEQFIAVKTCSDENAGTRTCNFISMKTLQVERSLSSRDTCLQYDGGYLFVSKTKNLVRILDVASGTFLRDIRVEPSKYGYTGYTYLANSNYVVIADFESKLHIYDLKCLKETDAVPTHLLLTTIDLECKMEGITMNETRIVCMSDNNAYVVDLQPIDRLRCPDSC